MDESNLWDTVKSFYKEKFGITPELIEVASVFDLLKMCASGSNNKSIAKFLDETEMRVAEILDAYFGFMGWSRDLEFSPLKEYKELSSKNINEFRDKIVTKYGYTDNVFIRQMFNSSEIVEKLERLLNEQWV